MSSGSLWVVGIVRGCPECRFFRSGWLGSFVGVVGFISGAVGVVGFIRVGLGGRWVHSGSLGLCWCALGVVGLIVGHWDSSRVP